MAEGARVQARQATEDELVADFAETAQLHGYKVTTHTVKVDHESGETRLSLSLLRGNPEQGVLPLKKKGKKDEGDGDGDD